MAVGKRIATDLSEDVILHVAKAQRDVAVHLTAYRLPSHGQRTRGFIPRSAKQAIVLTAKLV